MEYFLCRCAEYIYQKHAGELDHLCLVFPNRRSGIFFNSYLQEQLKSPAIGPEIVTVNELFLDYSDLFPGEKLQLISYLFDIFIAHTHSSESFDDFYFWGEVLLADFNDMDNYLVDARDIFTNLAGLKELEGMFDYLTPEQKKAIERFWGSFRGGEQKTHHEKFISIWQQLYPVYTDFKKILRQEGLAYNGMIARQVIDGFSRETPDFEFSKYYIIGLNVLNTCEKEFFKRMMQQQKADFLWDYDQFYLNDEKNEAGHFIRENLKLFPSPEDFQLCTSNFSKKKNLKLVAVSSNYGQAQEIPRFLAGIQPEYRSQFNNTAIVLADESLLYPALGAIPEDYGKINVTMGYPVKNSVVFGFLLLLINLLKNKRLDGNDRPVVYYRYVTDILNHQLMGNVEPEQTASFLAGIKKTNCISVPLDEINFSPLHTLIFTLPNQVVNYCPWFLSVLSHFFELLKNNNEENLLLSELVYTVYQSVEKLGTLITDIYSGQHRKLSDVVFFRLFNQYLSQVSVAFEGEPLSGLQVMGILETRCLDFRHVIILGLNENKWPRRYTAPSFIPYNLRKGFGLPGIDEQDAMYAYYFYRLIQRAEHVTATYSTLKEGIGTGELSRYGYQLKFDSGCEVQSATLDFRFLNDPVPAIAVPKSSQTTALLFERNSPARPLSPSAINIWLQCSLRFYFRYILQLGEPDEMKDEVDSLTFGNIFHEAIKNLYQAWIGKNLNGQDIERISKNKVLIENEILKAIGLHFFKQPVGDSKEVKLEGKTVLIFENIKAFLQQIFKMDIQHAPFQLVSLEEKYHFPLEIDRGGKKQIVYLGGTIDRVDKENGKLRILDYKTGNVESLSFKDLEDLFERDTEKPKKEILQTLAYCLVFSKSTGETCDLQPAIYSLRKLFDENFSPIIKQNNKEVIFRVIENEFQDLLVDLIVEIFSDTGYYVQTVHLQHCKYCPYHKICQRYSQ
ncbi:MAG: PD-(D/E)XK nuclease family protein [Mariniphaga sp.]|nr:PD-(D/E)XK nuclease family protein [Mariniphaga sp.]